MGIKNTNNKMKKTLLVLILFIGFISFSQNKKYTTYRVSQHETISSIARKLGVTPYDLSVILVVDEIPDKKIEILCQSKTYSDVKEVLIEL